MTLKRKSRKSKIAKMTSNDIKNTSFALFSKNSFMLRFK